MIAPFSPPMGYDAQKVPVASNAQIGEYAEKLLGEYRPELLRSPGVVDGAHFLEYFLGLSVEYQEIYTGRKPRILGVTAFGEGLLPVVVRSGRSAEVSLLKLREGTVVIDAAPSGDARKERSGELFTQLHEAGHWLLHGFHFRSLAAASGSAGGPGEADFRSHCACRERDIYGSAPGTERSMPHYRRTLEHQANVFASHFAMPEATLVPFAKDQIAALGYEEGVLEHQSAPEFDDEDLISLKKLLRLVSEACGVSEKAAEIRLRELGLVRSMEYWDLWEKRHHAGKNLHA